MPNPCVCVCQLCSTLVAASEGADRETARWHLGANPVRRYHWKSRVCCVGSARPSQCELVRFRDREGGSRAQPGRDRALNCSLPLHVYQCPPPRARADKQQWPSSSQPELLPSERRLPQGKHQSLGLTASKRRSSTGDAQGLSPELSLRAWNPDTTAAGVTLEAFRGIPIFMTPNAVRFDSTRPSSQPLQGSPLRGRAHGERSPITCLQEASASLRMQCAHEGCPQNALSLHLGRQDIKTPLQNDLARAHDAHASRRSSRMTHHATSW